MRRTATNLARLNTEQAAAPLPAAADASPPTSHSSAAVADLATASTATAAGLASAANPAGSPDSAAAADRPKGAALTSPSAVVVLHQYHV